MESGSQCPSGIAIQPTTILYSPSTVMALRAGCLTRQLEPLLALHPLYLALGLVFLPLVGNSIISLYITALIPAIAIVDDVLRFKDVAQGE